MKTSTLSLLESLADEHGLTILEIPVAEISPDPEQPRRDFTGEELTSDDEEALSSFAENVGALGVQQPLRVRARPDGDGYRIVTGERRWRAAMRAELATVPCIVESQERPRNERLLVQLSENLQRSDLKLLDVARTLAHLVNEEGWKAVDLAKTLGRSKAWVSQHLAAARAKGAAAQALEENLLTSPEAVRLFGKLRAGDQSRLLEKARTTPETLSRPRLAAAVERKRGERSRPESAPAGKAHGEPTLTVRLTATGLRALLRQLFAEEPAEDADLVALLLERVEGLVGQGAKET